MIFNYSKNPFSSDSMKSFWIFIIQMLEMLKTFSRITLKYTLNVCIIIF